LRALVDLCANGETASGNRDRVLVAATATGTAFEAGGVPYEGAGGFAEIGRGRAIGPSTRSPATRSWSESSSIANGAKRSFSFWRVAKKLSRAMTRARDLRGWRRFALNAGSQQSP